MASTCRGGTRCCGTAGSTAFQVRHRLLLQHIAGTNQPDRIRSWYNIVEGGAGFVLIEADDIRDVNAILDPYREFLGWDVVVERRYQDFIEGLLARVAEMQRGPTM